MEALDSCRDNLVRRWLDGDRSPSRHHIVLTRMIMRGSGEIGP
jgi:hypothetical protein